MCACSKLRSALTEPLPVYFLNLCMFIFAKGAQNETVSISVVVYFLDVSRLGGLELTLSLVQFWIKIINKVFSSIVFPRLVIT